MQSLKKAGKHGLKLVAVVGGVSMLDETRCFINSQKSAKIGLELISQKRELLDLPESTLRDSLVNGLNRNIEANLRSQRACNNKFEKSGVKRLFIPEILPDNINITCVIEKKD